MLYPLGTADDSYNAYWKTSGRCYTSTNKAGDVCGARVIEENWQMNY